MHTQTARRGFTQIIFRKTTPFTSPLEGEDVRRTKEGVRNKHVGATPHPASGHPLPQGARKTPWGFTLLELLVVVLIIGILAAVALPQYQKSVLKSRFASLMPLAKTLADGNEAYYMEHGEYADSTRDLDITTPTSSTATLSNEDQHQYVLLTRNDIKNNLRIYQKHSPNFAGETHCEALIDDTQANWLCKDSLQGTLVGDKYGYTVYSLSEQTVGTLGRTYYNRGGGRHYTYNGDRCIANGDCRGATYTNGAYCYGGGHLGCAGSTYDGSICEGPLGSNYGCSNSSFTNSTCISNGYQQCGSSSYTNKSICVGNSVRGCGCITNEGTPCQTNSTTFDQQSTCVGSVSRACWSTAFTNSSSCVADQTGACTGATYDATSYCSGNFCPNGAPSNEEGMIWYRGTGNDWPTTRASELKPKPVEAE